MTPAEFYELVAKMRTAQKTYFANRTQTNLRAAKGFEKLVDMAITEFRQPSNPHAPYKQELQVLSKQIEFYPPPEDS